MQNDIQGCYTAVSSTQFVCGLMCTYYPVYKRFGALSSSDGRCTVHTVWGLKFYFPDIQITLILSTVINNNGWWFELERTIQSQ